jgi:hypothetical protein
MASAASQRFTPYSKKKEGSTKPNQEELYQLPTSNTQDTERTPKLPYRHLETLMMNTAIPLNSSCSKEVVIGLNSNDQTFSPEMQIVRRSGSQRLGVSLTQSEWDKLLEQSEDITRYFEDSCKSHRRLKLGSIVLSFQIVYGKQTLVICKPVPEPLGMYLPDTVAIQKPSWNTLLSSKSFVTQALQDAAALTEKAKTQFDILSKTVIHHLRVTTSLNTNSDDQEITEAITGILRTIDLNGLGSFQSDVFLLCHSIFLFCIPLFVSRFKLCTYYSSC